MIMNIIVLVLAYFLGAIPSAYIIGKCFCKLNIMEHGSGNVGATNTFRVLGPKYGAIVFLMDIGKGFLAAFIGAKIGGETIGVVCGLISIVAHTLSVFIGFKGGKGVATGAGVVFAWCPPAILCALAVWALVALISGYISLASIIACLSCAVFMIVFGGSLLQCIICALAVAFIIYKHKSNIKRLMNHTENHVDWKKAFAKLKK